jgi:serine/threonine-protein kinase
VKLCDAGNTYGISWGGDNSIVFGLRRAIWRVSADGGKPQQMTAPAAGEARHLLPQLLPGGSSLLFTLQRTINDWEDAQIVVQSLATGQRKTLIEGAADARYVPTGHLLFMRLGKLVSVPFDAARLQVIGGETVVANGVVQSVNSTVPNALDTGAGQYAFSGAGLVAYVGGPLLADMDSTLEWIRRDGTIETIPAPKGHADFLPRISPDGQTLVVGTLGLRDQNLWRYDIAVKTLTRLTTEGRAEQAVWSPDGSRLAFAVSLHGFQNVFWMASDGSAQPQQLTSGTKLHFPGTWTRDGRTLVIDEGGDIVELDVDGAHTVRPLIATEKFTERMPDLSPDGQWLTYVSDETGRDEVYVRAFPDLGAKHLISTAGGTEPGWSRDGRKLTFVSRPGPRETGRVKVMEADVTIGRAFSARPARMLFELDPEHYSGASRARSYDVTADASRFVFVHESYPAAGPPLREVEIVPHGVARSN